MNRLLSPLINDKLGPLLAGITLLMLAGCGAESTGASYNATVTMRDSAMVPGGDSGEPGKNGSTDNGQTPTKASGFGTLTGLVRFVGTPPNLDDIAPTKQTDICMPHKNEALIVNPETKGVQNVFVCIKKRPSGAEATSVPSAPALFDQQGCVFRPHAQLVRVDQQIIVKNSDGVAHNTKASTSLSTPFDSGGLPKLSQTEFAYDNAEKQPIVVTCSYHGWMKAWQFPLKHSYAALTGADGRFVLGGSPDNPEGLKLPAGKYKLQVWHESAGSGPPSNRYLEKNLAFTITANETTDITIDYPARKLSLTN